MRTADNPAAQRSLSQRQPPFASISATITFWIWSISAEPGDVIFRLVSLAWISEKLLSTQKKAQEQMASLQGAIVPACFRLRSGHDLDVLPILEQNNREDARCS
jgi:hypothetical protein